MAAAGSTKGTLMPLVSVVLTILMGLAAGLLSVLLGVGGGIIIVPSLMYLAGMDIKMATGTSLAIIIPTAIVGTVGRVQAGQVDWKIAALVAVGAVAGAYAGKFLVSIAPDLWLKRSFAILLLFTAGRMLLTK